MNAEKSTLKVENEKSVRRPSMFNKVCLGGLEKFFRLKLATGILLFLESNKMLNLIRPTEASFRW